MTNMIADRHQLTPALNERDDRAGRMCRCDGRDKQELEVEVRREDAFLERSELGEGEERGS